MTALGSQSSANDTGSSVLLATGGYDNSIRFWSVHNGQTTRIIPQAEPVSWTLRCVYVCLFMSTYLPFWNVRYSRFANFVLILHYSSRTSMRWKSRRTSSTWRWPVTRKSNCTTFTVRPPIRSFSSKAYPKMWRPLDFKRTVDGCIPAARTAMHVCGTCDRKTISVKRCIWPKHRSTVPHCTRIKPKFI